MGETTEKAETARGKKMEEKTEKTKAAPESKTETTFNVVDWDIEGPARAISRRRALWVRVLNLRMRVLSREIERKEGVKVHNLDAERKRMGLLKKGDWSRELVHSSFTKGIYHYSLRWRRCGKKGCNYCPHGPYWFLQWRQNGKRTMKYLGRTLRMVDSQNEYSLALEPLNTFFATTRTQHGKKTQTAPSHVL